MEGWECRGEGCVEGWECRGEGGGQSGKVDVYGEANRGERREEGGEIERGDEVEERNKRKAEGRGDG